MDHQNCRVTVVMAVGEHGPSLRETMHSVLDGQDIELELVIAATDPEAGAVREAGALADSRIRIIRAAAPARAAALNAALAAATGELVAFIDPGDLFLPGKLAREAAWLAAHPEAAMVRAPLAGVGPQAGAGVASDLDYPAAAFSVPGTFPLSTLMVWRSVAIAAGAFDGALGPLAETDWLRRLCRDHRAGAIPEAGAVSGEASAERIRRVEPAVLLKAYNAYVDTVIREDGPVIAPMILGAGARRLGGALAAAYGDLEPAPEAITALCERARALFRPRVSIVIPVYNGADYLADAIESALGQTYDNLEVIVVNDGSTDDGASAAVARRFGDRIRYLEKPNGGVATALNTGIEAMGGEYFSWLSHDDLYLPEKIESQVGTLVQLPDPRRHVVYGDCGIFSGDPAHAKPLPLPGVAPEYFRYFLTASNELHGCALLIPRAAFAEHGRFDPVLRTTQDYDTWFRIAESWRFVHRPGVVVLARSHPGQGTQNMSELVVRECNTLLAGFVERLSAAEVRHGSGCALAEGYFELALNLQSRGFELAGARAYDLFAQSLAELSPRELFVILSREAETNRALADARVQILGLEAEIARQAAEICNLLQVQQNLHTQLQSVYESRSWRVTEPLRQVADTLAGWRR